MDSFSQKTKDINLKSDHFAKNQIISFIFVSIKNGNQIMVYFTRRCELGHFICLEVVSSILIQFWVFERWSFNGLIPVGPSVVLSGSHSDYYPNHHMKSNGLFWTILI